MNSGIGNPGRQRGLALTSVLIAILITTVLAAIAAGQLAQRVNDAAATSTGAYLIHVRGAILDSLTRHHHAYTLIDTSTAPSGSYPPAPPWAGFAGTETTLSISDLKDADLLADDFPNTPPLGRSAHIQLVRTGICPGSTCGVQAFVYTCWPISTARPTGALDHTICPSPPASLEHDAGLTGAVLLASNGFGATNSVDPALFKGTLFTIPAAALGLPANSPGHAVVIASLHNTLFNQFVRQGDTRHIFLNDRLTVDGIVQTNTGLLLNTDVNQVSSCETEGIYATSNNQTLAMCKGGQWVELINHVIVTTQTASHGQALPIPTCPGPNLEPFFAASLQQSDVTVTGDDISVHGTQTGSVSGSGAVNNSGSVAVSGTFSGSFQSSPGSTIRTGQQVSVSPSGIVSISPASPDARALVIGGCRVI
ncbi:hypothetical protein ACYCFK_09395 [Stutzerimonas stutzeri]